MKLRFCSVWMLTAALVAIGLSNCICTPAFGFVLQTENNLFEEKFERWNVLSKRLDEIFELFQESKGSEELKAEFEKKRTEALELLPTLQKIAIETYTKAPNASKDVTEVMMMSLNKEVGTDNFIEANRIADLMIKNKSDAKGLYDLAGTAAFATDRFETAKTYFAKAKENETLSARGAQFASNIDKFVVSWKKEVEIRKKEAEANDLPRVKFETTAGNFVVELYENQAPGAVGNFISLVEKGYYDGLNFHRVLPNFMAQGGCPTGTGTGGPGYNIKCECEREDFRRHFSGTLSMAHAGKDTGGSQFFVTFLPTPSLDGRHTAFGRVVEGLEILPLIEKVDPRAPRGTTTKMTKVSVVRKRDHEYVPDKSDK